MIIESTYPVDFRKKDAAILGEQIKNRQSVVLIGMKRVGISNFLRFFLYHKDIIPEYIGSKEKHLFIPVDLHDLIERELFPFWVLTLKRVCDVAMDLSLEERTKRQIESLFLNSIQTHDTFLVFDSLRSVIIKLCEAGYLPTIFFIRFDRMEDIMNQEFFANIQGLRDATHQRLAYVFTSFKSLDVLFPDIFNKQALNVFAKNVHLQPAEEKDIEAIYQTYCSRYDKESLNKIKKELLGLTDGYVQFLQLGLIVLHERNYPEITADELYELLLNDERFSLQSEEIWESLSTIERDVLRKIVQGKDIIEQDIDEAKYLFETGIVKKDSTTIKVFSPLFKGYIEILKSQHDVQNKDETEFSKKEHELLNLLLKYKNNVVDRELIIDIVWPEVEPFDVTDWAIDRLVSRLRSKLKTQKSNYRITTVRTRGYKLTEI